MNLFSRLFRRRPVSKPAREPYVPLPATEPEPAASPATLQEIFGPKLFARDAERDDPNAVVAVNPAISVESVDEFAKTLDAWQRIRDQERAARLRAASYKPNSIAGPPPVPPTARPATRQPAVKPRRRPTSTPASYGRSSYSPSSYDPTSNIAASSIAASSYSSPSYSDSSSSSSSSFSSDGGCSF